MPGWTLVDAHPTQGRTFRRPLDVCEQSFVWDGLFNGTSDNIQHFELRLVNGHRDAYLFSDASIVRAWLSTKRRYPLVGATVQGVNARDMVAGRAGHSSDDDAGVASELHFVVREADLGVLRQSEIVFGEVANAEEAQRRADAILDGPRPLSKTLLVQLYAFREARGRDVLHLMTLMSHCITDSVANHTFMRCLLDTLARDPAVEDQVQAQVPLEERLAMLVPSAELEPKHLRSLSPARKRWRRVVGAVIFQLRMAKRQGGHTLPCRITRSTPHTAAKSRHVSIALTPSQSALVLANCHLHNVTFGNAFLPLAQVAMTKVLYRRYLRGEIAEVEWAYRKRQPHYSAGPLNLRSYLDRAWFERGGGGEFMLSISFFFNQLPFMTLGIMAERLRGGHETEEVSSDGTPSFSEFLTFDRFLHRAGLVKKQAEAFFQHPLFFEIVRAVNTAFLEKTRLVAQQWMRPGSGTGNVGSGEDGDSEVLGVTDMPSIWAHSGSSAGNWDTICPAEYPLLHSHPLSPYSSIPHLAKAGYITPPSQPATQADTDPKIVVENVRLRLHMRPTELYLGAFMLRGRLNMFVFYDGNVFEDIVVSEWLGEVQNAMLWYLGQTHRSRLERERDRHGGRAGVDRGSGAKL